MLGTHAGDAGAARLSQEEQCKEASLLAAPPSFEAPNSLPALPPAVQLAVRHEFAARFGAAPSDGDEVLTLFGKSLLDEYATSARAFQSRSEPAHAAEALDARGTGTNHQATAESIPAGHAPGRRRSSTRFASAAKALQPYTYPYPYPYPTLPLPLPDPDAYP